MDTRTFPRRCTPKAFVICAVQTVISEKWKINSIKSTDKLVLCNILQQQRLPAEALLASIILPSSWPLHLGSIVDESKSLKGWCHIEGPACSVFEK